MEKQNAKDSRSGLEESAVQQDIHSIHTEQTVSDRQQKDQSEMMYVKLVGLPKADVNQISVTPGKRVQPVYKTPEQFWNGNSFFDKFYKVQNFFPYAIPIVLDNEPPRM